MLRGRKEHQNKSLSMQALDKGPGTEKRLGLEEAWGRGYFHSQLFMAIHEHLFTPSAWKQLGFHLSVLCANPDPSQTDLPET